jgi:HK97 family phage major capsid protein/HK97 family phage prohead protease
MNRAYALLTVKAVNEDLRIITGVATTPTPDRVGDIVEPLGVKFKNPMPLLWQHRSAEPVGHVRFDKPTKEGITFEAKMPKVEEPGRLKDRLDEAWQSVKLGLVRAVSIGFRSIEHAFMDDGGIRFIESEVLELSLVTIPAQADAKIETIKSIDAEVRAASGRTLDDVDRPKPPGETGKRSTPVVKAKEARTMKKTFAEQISAYEATRSAKAARMEEIMATAAEKGETLDAEQTEEYDGLAAEVKAIDEHLVRLRAHEETNKKAAVVIEGVKGADDAGKLRGGVSVVVRQPNLPKGMAFVRMVGALASAKGNRLEAADIAKRWHDSTPEVEAVLRTPLDMIEKTAVTPGTTTGATWAEPLVQYTNMAGEFIEYLRPLTIIGRIQGFRRVPFKIKVPRQTAGATVNWVGEAKVKPLSSLAFDSLTLDHFKIAGIIPLSEELVRFSTPSAEMLVRDDLAAAIVQFMDREFVDPTKALAAGVSPASITNGVTPVTATGATAAAFRADVKTLMGTFLTAGVPVSTGVWIMTQAQALSLALMQNALGQPEFPNISMQGGTLLGFPVVVSENIPATGGSPADGSLIIFAVAGEIMLADDGGVNIDVSREASLQMETAPDSPAVAGTVLVSLWQHNMIAIKAERFINWLKRRSTAVAFIQNAKYAA